MKWEKSKIGVNLLVIYQNMNLHLSVSGGFLLIWDLLSEHQGREKAKWNVIIEYLEG